MFVWMAVSVAPMLRGRDNPHGNTGRGAAPISSAWLRPKSHWPAHNYII